MTQMKMTTMNDYSNCGFTSPDFLVGMIMSDMIKLVESNRTIVNNELFIL